MSNKPPDESGFKNHWQPLPEARSFFWPTCDEELMALYAQDAESDLYIEYLLKSLQVAREELNLACRSQRRCRGGRHHQAALRAFYGREPLRANKKRQSQAAACVTKNRPIGLVLQAPPGLKKSNISKNDREAVSSASHFVIDTAECIEAELEVAGKIKQSLFHSPRPKKIPPEPALDIHHDSFGSLIDEKESATLKLSEPLIEYSPEQIADMKVTSDRLTRHHRLKAIAGKVGRKCGERIKRKALPIPQLSTIAEDKSSPFEEGDLAS